MDIGARCHSVWSCHEVIKDHADSEKFDRNVELRLEAVIFVTAPTFLCVYDCIHVHCVRVCVCGERERERELYLK